MQLADATADKGAAERAAVEAKRQFSGAVAALQAQLSKSMAEQEQVVAKAAEGHALLRTVSQALVLQKETAAAVNASYDFAKKVGLDGTPTFIINGRMYPGAMDEAGFAAAFAKK